jgi:hypothetical protein
VTCQFARELLEEAGINSQRLALEWASAAEAPLYVRHITGFTRTIQRLGPLGEAEGIPQKRLAHNLSVLRSLVEGKKARTRLTRLTLVLRKERDYELTHVRERLREALAEGIISENLGTETPKQ